MNLKEPPDVPKTLHELLRLALDDFDIVTKQSDVKVDMSTWKYTNKDNVCLLCFAGSVMRNTFKMEENINSSLFDVFFTKPWVMAFFAIDSMRKGHVKSALSFFKMHEITFDEKLKAEKLDFDSTYYHNDPAIWRDEMENLYEKLKEAEL
jgi:hypothetical protein